MNAAEILSRDEVLAVLADLRKRVKRGGLRARQNLILFRLSCCCGLRRVEIRGLNLGDVSLTGARPVLRVRKEVTKGQEGKRKGRLVPLWWDGGTLKDLSDWMAYRKQSGAGPLDPFLAGRTGARLGLLGLSRRWTTQIKRALGEERARIITLHHGRHSFISHAANCGRSLTSIRDAVGHSNIKTTNQYLHVIEQDGIPDLFAEPANERATDH